MRYTNLILILALVVCVIPGASASWFNETSATLLTDVEDGFKDLVIAVLALGLLYSTAATLIGHFGHNQMLFKSGVCGFGVIAGVIILYALAKEISEYFFDTYW